MKTNDRTYGRPYAESQDDMIGALREMQRVLEMENTALLKGDAVTVGELASEKLRLSERLEHMRPASNDVHQELRQLGKQVRDLANSNHLLIEHMHQYYVGILSLVMRMNGQTQTYGQHGYMNVPAKMQAPTRREIIA